MARAVRYSEYGDPEVLHVVDVEVPRPGEGEVLIEVRAAGVNPIDWKIRRGLRASEPLTAPRGIGYDASGVVLQAGPGVTSLQAGDAVIGFNLDGAYASHVVGPATKFVPKPEGLGWEEAAGFGVPGGTAYQSLKSLGVAAGETIVIHGASGAVGQVAVQLARLWGATVVGTASEPNHERLVALGAIPVAYGEGLLERIRQAAPGGVDAVLDCAGTTEALEVSLQLVADRQRIGTIVVTPEAVEAGIQVWTSSMPQYFNDELRGLRAEAMPYLAELAARGDFEVEIAGRYPLELAAEAHRRSETGHVRGKLVLMP